jgi:hypothetical protein
VFYHKPAVLPHGISAQRALSLGAVTGEKVERFIFGVPAFVRRGFDPIQEPRGGVVLPTPFIHRGKEMVGVMDGDFGAFCDNIEIPVRYDRCDFDYKVSFGIEPGHLHIYPDEMSLHS